MKEAASVVWVVVLALVAGAEPSTGAERSGSWIGSAQAAVERSSPAALESWRVDLDVERLAAAPQLLELALPGRPAQAFRASGIEQRRAGELTWRGRPEQGTGLAVLTLHERLVAGLVYLGDDVWEISPDPAGGHRLERLDQELFPLCGEPLSEPGGAVAPSLRELRAVDRRPGGLTTVDVLVTYTPQARDAAGGTAAIEATAQAAVDIANTAFLDSEVDVRFRLALAALSTRNDSGNYGADLSWLRSDPTTAALRDDVGADLVSLLVENAGGVCGVGYLGPSPSSVYQVTARGCAVGNLTWAHEHGHNIGMQHDPANGNPPGGSWRPWAFGHWVSTNPEPPGGNFRTVMSYSAQCPYGCTRVPHFSHPGVAHNGVPTGLDDGACDPGTYDPGNPEAWSCRDNHRTANESGPIVATYRDAPLVFSDGFESGSTGAWSFAVP